MASSDPTPSKPPSDSPTPPQGGLLTPSPKYHGTPPLQHHLQLLAAFSSIAALLILRRQTKLSLSSPLTHPPPPVWQKALFYSATYLSFSGLAHDYTGKSIYKRTNDRLDSLFSSSSSSSQSSNSIFNPLPEQAQRTKQLIKEERERRRLAEGKPPTEAKEEEEKKGVITKIWMGGEKDGWQERRMEEEKKALEEGKGYGDLIMEQIYEVFGWGGKKDGEKKEKPEEKKND